MSPGASHLVTCVSRSRLKRGKDDLNACGQGLKFVISTVAPNVMAQAFTDGGRNRTGGNKQPPSKAHFHSSVGLFLKALGYCLSYFWGPGMLHCCTLLDQLSLSVVCLISLVWDSG